MAASAQAHMHKFIARWNLCRQFCLYSHAARTDDHFSTSQHIILTGAQLALAQACSKTLHQHCHARMGLLQKGYGQCSASFMLTTSSANPNGFCANTCGRCNCTSLVSSSSPGAATNSPVTVSSTVSSPGAMPSSPEATLASTGAVPSSPVSAVKSPAVPTLGPPAPLSAAYLANCDCTDVPPSGTTCPALVSFSACLCIRPDNVLQMQLALAQQSIKPYTSNTGHCCCIMLQLMLFLGTPRMVP